MKNEEFIKLKNSIARKSVIKILLYSLVAIISFSVLIDGVYNDELADSLASVSRDIYYWCVANKIILLGITYLVIFAIISFFVIRNTSNNMVEIIKAMDQIIKEPEKEVKLSNDLILLESKLNNIRVDLVSNQNKAKEALQKKNDLIMYMAHDLKTPLTSVVAYLSMLDSHPEMPAEERAKYTQISLEKANRLGDLLKEFFESIKLNLQDIELDKVDIDLTMMLEQIADELYGVLQEKMLTCKVEAEEEILIEGDPDKLARVFDNILRNAIAYCREKSVLLIQAAKEENQVRICFENEGDTIPEESLKRIFDKFYRADASRSSSTGGAGLGLAIAKEIVELHKGQIIAESSGGKTRFIVTLPLKGGVESNEIHTHSGHSSGGRAGRRKFLHRKATGRTVE